MLSEEEQEETDSPLECCYWQRQCSCEVPPMYLFIVKGR